MKINSNTKGSFHSAVTAADTGLRPVPQVDTDRASIIIEVLPWHGWELRQAR